MLERVSAEDDLADHREDSVDTQDSLQGAAAAGLPDSATPAAGDIVLPSTIPRRSTDDSWPPTSSSAGSKPATEASTLPIRGMRSLPDAVHRLLAAGPADSVRDTAGKPVCIRFVKKHGGSKPEARRGWDSWEGAASPLLTS